MHCSQPGGRGPLEGSELMGWSKGRQKLRQKTSTDECMVSYTVLSWITVNIQKYLTNQNNFITNRCVMSYAFCKENIKYITNVHY